MGWETTLSNRLRFYIGDTTATPTYTTAILAQYIAIAAVSVASEIVLGVDFTIDTDTPEITPDPTDSAYDIGIGNLFVLKAAVIITRSEIRKDVAKYGIKIKDDLTLYDATAALKGRLDAFKEYTSNYEDAQWAWELGNKPAVQGIFGPFQPDDGTYHEWVFGRENEC
jgi:hypothetical protein